MIYFFKLNDKYIFNINVKRKGINNTQVTVALI